MLNLERLERAAILILIAALVSGIGVMAYRKTRPPMAIDVTRFDTVGYDKHKININEADAGALMRLKGIGKVLAERIVEYRGSNGHFASIEGVKKVKGIGAALFETIKDEITVE